MKHILSLFISILLLSCESNKYESELEYQHCINTKTLERGIFYPSSTSESEIAKSVNVFDSIKKFENYLENGKLLSGIKKKDYLSLISKIEEDEFLKNEYILNLNELLMTRNYVYNEKTYQKYRITDLSVKKSNTYVRNIYQEDGKIFTLKHGYPQFYTQILFYKEKPEVFMKSVLNDIEGISKISTCKKIEKFDLQS